MCHTNKNVCQMSSIYKPNKNLEEYNDRMIANAKSLQNHLNIYLSEKYTEEECNLMQPLIHLITQYMIYSGLYDDVTFHLSKLEDIREVVQHARNYFIEASFGMLHSEEPISQKMEKDLIEYAFFSLETAVVNHIESLEKLQPELELMNQEKPEEKAEEKPEEITDDNILLGAYEDFMSQ